MVGGSFQIPGLGIMDLGVGQPWVQAPAQLNIWLLTFVR